MAVAPRVLLDGGSGPPRKPKTTQPAARPPVTYNDGGMVLADPASEAAKRAQARLSSGELAAQQGLKTRLQGFDQTRTRLKDDSEWALRTGAEANMRHLTGQNAINSGLRDRFAERLQGQVNRPLMRNLGDLDASENLARGQTAESIAQLQANLPVMQAEELERQHTMDAQGLQNALSEASVTGRYVPQAARPLINQVLSSKVAWEQANAAGDQAGMVEAHRMAEQARASLAAMGISPNQLSADTARGDAERNVPGVGIVTPTNRQLMANLFGIDPITGQQTLGGRQANQAIAQGDLALTRDQLGLAIDSNPNYGLGARAAAGMRGTNQSLAMGDLNYAVASNPSYGLGAQAQAGISASNQGLAKGQQGLDLGQIELDIARNPQYGAAAGAQADINYKNAQAQNVGKEAAAKDAKIDRTYIQNKYGLARVSPLTTDYAALDQLLTEVIESGMTYGDVQEYVRAEGAAIRAGRVDPKDVLAVMEAILGGGSSSGAGSSASGGSSNSRIYPNPN